MGVGRPPVLYVMPVAWDKQFLGRSPMFEPLRPAGAALARLDVWPGLCDYQQLVDSACGPILCGSGLPLRVVPQGERADRFCEQYEPRVYLAGELQTRAQNWHDLFNVLAWVTFPRAKAAINARHYFVARGQPRGNRGAVRDLLTLFDESGVVVACADRRLERLLKDFRWRELFWQRRHEVEAGMKFYLFGHALYEKALRPYVGMTGKGIVLAVTKELLERRLEAQLPELDERLALLFRNQGALSCPRDLHPVPVLGVPGWTADNEREAFYANTRYFRPRRIAPQPPAE